MTTPAMIRTMRRYAKAAADLVTETVPLVLRTPEALPSMADIQPCKQATRVSQTEESMNQRKIVSKANQRGQQGGIRANTERQALCGTESNEM
jgi:hypothetical protein